MESVGNSTIQTLGYADTSSSTSGYYPNIFDGTPQETTDYGSVHITCQADSSGILRAMHSIDNSLWDFTDNVEYPGNDSCIGDTIYIRKDLKAKWYKTQFEHQDTSIGAECNLRLQTVFHPAVTPAEPIDVKLYPTIEVSIGQGLTMSVGNITASLSSEVTILNDPLSINIKQQDLSYVTVSGPVVIQNEQLRVNLTHQDLSYVTISGSVTQSTDPISQVWESDEIYDTVTAVSSQLILYNIYCINFAPDYRFVKLYDTCGTVTVSDRPKMTLPIVADIPFHMQFPKGLLFNNALQVKATRCIHYGDTNLAQEGDVHVIVTYVTT